MIMQSQNCHKPAATLAHLKFQQPDRCRNASLIALFGATSQSNGRVVLIMPSSRFLASTSACGYQLVLTLNSAIAGHKAVIPDVAFMQQRAVPCGIALPHRFTGSSHDSPDSLNLFDPTA
jgi:hypothetical protein